MIAQEEPKIGQVWFSARQRRYVRILNVMTVYICIETVDLNEHIEWCRTPNTRYSRIRRENFRGYLLHEEASP